jgi:hypothetical protein
MITWYLLLSFLSCGILGGCVVGAINIDGVCPNWKVGRMGVGMIGDAVETGCTSVKKCFRSGSGVFSTINCRISCLS